MKSVLGMLILSFLGTTANAKVFSVSNATQLTSALSKAKGGDVISLAGGNYGSINWNGTNTKHKFLSRYTSEVQITSASSTNQAVFSSIKAMALKNVAFVGVTVKSSGAARMVDLYISQNVRFDNVKFIGVAVNGYGTNVGFQVTDIQSLKIQNSRFDYFLSAMNLYKVTDLVVEKNVVDNIAYDVLQMAYVTNGLIQNNQFTKKANPNLDNHQDLIQIANNVSASPAASNIRILNNKLSADDVNTHGIYIDNKESQGSNKTSDYYRNIVIENNEILTGQVLGIAVAETIGLSIRNNKLLQHTKVTGTHPVYVPSIRIGRRCSSVDVTNNTVHLDPVVADNAKNWTPLTTRPAGFILAPNTTVTLR